MSDLTLKAVVRQLGAMRCAEFRIGVFNRKDDIMINKDNLSNEQIINMIPWLKHQNVNGKDIYIRPAANLDRALLLVDDLVSRRIQEMRLRGVAPACVVETSPGNFQAWVSLGSEPMAKPERKAAARLLAQQFAGDIASADATHYGRLAGFTNRKESRLTSSGYPFVICRWAGGLDAERSLPLRRWAQINGLEAGFASTEESVPKRKRSSVVLGPNQDPCAAYELYYDQWLKRIEAKGKSMDASRGDFAVVCRMLKEGYDENQIGMALQEKSPNIQIRKKNHIHYYSQRTIKAAKKLIK